ncbi:hypothetical protein PUN28_015331 [Cardiocondyla obscurior]|uniref:Uncharacterized protein n=1 Tax=Cardiocondyla obscurior TaxID=286306 RepID=A0AAW2EXH7_9HYME
MQMCFGKCFRCENGKMSRDSVASPALKIAILRSKGALDIIHVRALINARLTSLKEIFLAFYYSDCLKKKKEINKSGKKYK